MTVRRLLMLLCPAIATGLLATRAPAQGRTEFPVSVDVTVGTARGSGGPALAPYRNGNSIDAGATYAFHAVRGGKLLLGVNLAKQGHIGDDLICLVSPGTSGCVPYYPQFKAASVLFGWQSARPERGRIRLLGGPGMYRASVRDIGPSLGWQGRVDVSSPPLMHVALVLSARTWVIPDANGVRYRQQMLGGGIRIQ